MFFRVKYLQRRVTQTNQGNMFNWFYENHIKALVFFSGYTMAKT